MLERGFGKRRTSYPVRLRESEIYGAEYVHLRVEMSEAEQNARLRDALDGLSVPVAQPSYAPVPLRAVKRTDFEPEPDVWFRYSECVLKEETDGDTDE